MQDITLPESRARALTREQKESWDRDGYLILPQFFGPDIVDPVETGLVVPPGDAQALAHAMRTLLENRALLSRMAATSLAR